MPARKLPPPTIRQCRRADYPQIWALAALVTRQPGEAPIPLPPADAAPADCPDLVDIGREFVQSGGDFLVADVAGSIVGTAGLLLGSDGAADVVRLTVHPAVRRQGIGTALLEAVERRAVGLGIRTLNLDVGDDARDAIAFYRAAGFRRAGEDDAAERWDVRFFSKAI